MLSYLALRHLHITCVVITSLLFLLRGGLTLVGVPWQQRWPVLRWLPHLNDTLLLFAAIALAVLSGQYPFAQGWLTAKLLGLIAYIVLGTLALKRAQTRRGQALAFAGALACLAYIIAVASTRSPWPWL
ncbi:SirB2 family protein [Chitinilyticum litopenaei]|uniref:SirB2 family protein n=1 Tax=Chitinilyticum litopenaei TaxID=1121276 RepID=UPI000410DB9E|nr:SirB2 family protein [Chitinilyticum litopenaei]